MHQCAVVEVVVVNEVNVRPPAAILVVDKRRNMTRSLPQFFFLFLGSTFPRFMIVQNQAALLELVQPCALTLALTLCFSSVISWDFYSLEANTVIAQPQLWVSRLLQGRGGAQPQRPRPRAISRNDTSSLIAISLLPLRLGQVLNVIQDPDPYYFTRISN